MSLRGLDLFSGIGGISLALKPWVNTVAYCECESYCQAVLLERMASGDLDIAPIWDDVRTLNREILDTQIDIIFGGFPCQDISVAGNGAGLAGKRSGLFFEIMRLAKEFKPTFLFLENVAAITSRGLETVVGEISRLGYDCRWDIVSASDVGAPHLRKRWWLLAAHTERLKLWVEQGGSEWKSGKGKAITGNDGEKELLADAAGKGLEKWGSSRFTTTNEEARARLEQQSERLGSAMADCTRLEIRKPCENCNEQSTSFSSDWWAVEPAVGRVVNGLPYRVDRIKSLGNGVVPQAARKAFIRLAGIE